MDLTARPNRSITNKQRRLLKKDTEKTFWRYSKTEKKNEDFLRKLTRGTWVDFHHNPMHLSVSKIKDIMKVAQAFPLQLLHIHEALGYCFVVFPLIESGVWNNQAQVDLLASTGGWTRPWLKDTIAVRVIKRL